jgi:hypothetical protein
MIMLCKIVVSGTCKATCFCKTDVMIVFDGAQKKLEPEMVYKNLDWCTLYVKNILRVQHHMVPSHTTFQCNFFIDMWVAKQEEIGSCY